MKIILSAAFLLVPPPALWGEATGPDHNFSLDQLQVFYPGNSLENISRQHGKGTLYAPDLRRFLISHRRYRFPLFLQSAQDRSVGLMASLPTYFLHDTFHQGLIDRYGKQDQYLKRENSALFVWNHRDGIKIIYSAQCTLTCFPNYLLVINPQSSNLLKDFSTSPSGQKF